MYIGKNIQIVFFCLINILFLSHFSAAQLQSKLKSYTTLRKQREEFRNRLVNLIVSKKDESTSQSPDDIPTEEEKEMLRYYYYVKHGVDTVHVAPLDEKVLGRVSTRMVIYF